MTELSDRLARDRAARDAARQALEANVAQVKADLAARGIGGRIADKAVADATTALDEAVAIAKESKGIIAATGLALLLWLLRNPLAAMVRNRFSATEHDQ